jgi:hypothetical protein
MSSTLQLNGLTETEKLVLLSLLMKIKLTEEEREWEDSLDSEMPFEGGVGLEEGIVFARFALEDRLEKDSKAGLLLHGLNSVSNLYIATPWPENQSYMDEEWWEDEAILDVDSKLGDNTYLIPINRL